MGDMDKAQADSLQSEKCCRMPREGCEPCCCYYACRGHGKQPQEPKVPEISLMFWIIKIISTGMGESMSDAMGGYSPALNGGVSVFFLSISFWLQFRATKYWAPTYWFAVMMVAVFGTAMADAIAFVTTMPSPYYVTFPVFLCLTIAMFTYWYRLEGTLSIHAITTRRREGFYWWAVFMIFMMGTALGDFTAFVPLSLGYLKSIYIFLGIFATAPLMYLLKYVGIRINSIFIFWWAYLWTRPLGASFSDWVGKPPSETCIQPFGSCESADVSNITCPNGTGLDFGDWQFSLCSFAVFAVLVVIQTVTKADIQPTFEKQKEMELESEKAEKAEQP